MLAVEHADHDAEESGEFRHSFSSGRWFHVGITTAFQPRRLTIAPAAVGCKRWFEPMFHRVSAERSRLTRGCTDSTQPSGAAACWAARPSLEWPYDIPSARSTPRSAGFTG